MYDEYFFLIPVFICQVCIKSASPIVPAPRSVIERRIRQQQIETNKRSSRSSSVVTNKVKVIFGNILLLT